RVPNLSDRLLTERLRELEGAGMVTREVHPGPPVRVVYELTAAGRALSDIIRAVAAWAHEWMPGRAEYVCVIARHLWPLVQAGVQPQDGDHQLGRDQQDDQRLQQRRPGLLRLVVQERGRLAQDVERLG